MTRRRLIVIGALPPPYHGVTVSNSLILANPLLRERFAVEHVDTSDRRSGDNMGRWDVTNVALGLRGALSLARRLTGDPGVVYLPLSQNVGAVLRDALFVQLAAMRGWKVATHLRGSEFRDLYARQPGALRRWMRFTLSRIDSIAVLGDSLRWVFEGLVPDDRIAVVPNGTPDPGSDGSRRNSDTVLFLSNLRRRKGVAEAVEAALAVVRRRPGARFVFAGSWEEPRFEREMCARAEAAAGAIRFLAPVSSEEKLQLLLSSSVLLFPPGEPEGHPRVVLEAMGAGLPVVTTNRGAIAETVIDGECGYVLDDPVPHELAERLLTLLERPELRERMGRAARERYLRNFTQEIADRNLADWLERVAREERGERRC